MRVYNSHNNLDIPMDIALSIQFTGNGTIYTEEGFIGNPDTTNGI